MENKLKIAGIEAFFVATAVGNSKREADNDFKHQGNLRKIQHI